LDPAVFVLHRKQDQLALVQDVDQREALCAASHVAVGLSRRRQHGVDVGACGLAPAPTSIRGVFATEQTRS